MSFSYGLSDFSFGERDGESRRVSENEIAQKHQDLKEATEVRMKTLEALGQQREKELAQERSNLKALKDDFEYNLNLIQERDKELEQFEDAVETMKLAVEERDQDLARLKIQLEETELNLRQERQRAAEAEKRHREDLLRVEGEKDALRGRYEAEIRELRIQIEQPPTPPPPPPPPPAPPPQPLVSEREEEWRRRAEDAVTAAQRMGEKCAALERQLVELRSSRDETDTAAAVRQLEVEQCTAALRTENAVLADQGERLRKDAAAAVAAAEAARRECGEKTKECSALQVELHKAQVDAKVRDREAQKEQQHMRTEHERWREKELEHADALRSLREQLGREASEERSRNARAVEELSVKVEMLQKEAAAHQKAAAAASEEAKKARDQLRTSETLRRREAADAETAAARRKEAAAPPPPSSPPWLPCTIHPGGFPSVPTLTLPDTSGITVPGNSDASAYQKTQQIVDLRAQVDDLLNKNHELATQNQKIRAQVRRFTEEMESEPIVQKTKQLQKEVDELRERLAVKEAEAAAVVPQTGKDDHLLPALAAELVKVKADLSAQRKRCAMLETLAQHPQPDHTQENAQAALELLKRKYTKLKQWHKEIAGDNKELRRHVSIAQEDVKRLTSEKRSLLEINNMLRADMSRLANADLSARPDRGRHGTAILPSRLVS